MDSAQYNISDSTTTTAGIGWSWTNDIYYCHNCGVKESPLRNISLFGLNFYLCNDCYKEFQRNQQKHGCPALNSDWYK